MASGNSARAFANADGFRGICRQQEWQAAVFGIWQHGKPGVAERYTQRDHRRLEAHALDGREYQLHSQHRILELSRARVQTSATFLERVAHADLLYLEQVYGHREWLLQRRERPWWWFDRSKLLRSEVGAWRLILRHTSFPVVGDGLRTSIRQGQTLGAKR